MSHSKWRGRWIAKGSVILSLIMACFVLLNINPQVKAGPLAGVAVKVTPAADAAFSEIKLSWQALEPMNEGSITYEVKTSTDGGFNFTTATSGATLTQTSWVDPEVENYTNVMYQVYATETWDAPEVGTTTSTMLIGRSINVYPPDENPHDNYMDNTDLCKNCHSTHAARGENLLNQATTTAICLTCHSGTNSKYDVMNGFTKTQDGNSPSLGGAFAHNGVEGNEEDAWNGASTTSAHIVDEYTEGAAPGGMNTTQTMGCTTCHSGHATGNYRNLKTSITVPSGENEITTRQIEVIGGAMTESPASGEKAVYMKGISSLCQSCHADYAVRSGSGGSEEEPDSEYDTPGMFRHPVDVSLRYKDKTLSTLLPLERNPEDQSEYPEKITCLTCHYAHGTVAQEYGVSAVVSGDGNTTQSSMSTALKRLNDAKLCQDCHKK